MIPKIANFDENPGFSEKNDLFELKIKKEHKSADERVTKVTLNLILITIKRKIELEVLTTRKTTYLQL